MNDYDLEANFTASDVSVPRLLIPNPEAGLIKSESAAFQTSAVKWVVPHLLAAGCRSCRDSGGVNEVQLIKCC